MDTRFLETFLMAVDHGSIAETARRLNLTAAAVAKRIRALESDIGAVLVTRSGRTIRPTEAGAAIVEHARRFLIEARDFKSIAATDRPSGQLRVGAFQSALSGLLPDILALMKENYPQIDVHVASGISSELYRKVLDGNDLDLAIIAEPPFAIPKSCHWRLLREEPLVLLIKASAASRKPHAILASEPFIRLDRNVWPGRLVDGYLRKAGIRPRELFEIEGARPRRSPLWWIEGSVCQSCRTGHRRGRKVCRSLNCRYRTPLLLQGASASCGPEVASHSLGIYIPRTGSGSTRTCKENCQFESAGATMIVQFRCWFQTWREGRRTRAVDHSEMAPSFDNRYWHR